MARRMAMCSPIISRSGFVSICDGGPPMPTTSLWPDFQAPEAVNSPVFLLKEQAAKLQQKTKGLVLAGLRPASVPDGGFWVGFGLYSPAPGAQTYGLLGAHYPLQFLSVPFTAADRDPTAQHL